MAVRKLRSHAMPPPKEPRPDEERLMSFVSWLEDALDEAAASTRGYQAIVPHRLNRKEYANAVRDLLALEVDGAEFLPQDEEVEHFDNIASGLQVSPSFIEQYVGAARADRRARRRSRPTRAPGGQTYFAPPGRQQSHVRGLPLGTRGGFVVTHLFPSDGEYEVNIADMFSHIWGNDSEFENTVVVTLDGRLVYETTVGGEEDTRAYDQVQNGVFEKVNARLKDIRFPATAGPHEVGVTFRRRTFAESDDQLQAFVPGGGQDRVFRVQSFEVSGPYNPTGLSATPSRDKVFVCHPSRGDDEQLCAERILSELATRAYRRPLAEEDLADILAYYRDGVASERLRGRHPQRPHGHSREPVFPLSHRDAARGRRARRDLRRRRRHAGVEAVVLPLEHDSRRRAARPCRARRARRREGAAAAGRADAERPARGNAREQLRVSLARPEAPRGGRARYVDLPVCLGPRRSARRTT